MTSRLLAVIALLVCQSPALALQSFTVTREELAMMPPYCTALDGDSVGLPSLPLSPLRNTVPPDCPAIRHYCDGLKAMIRVDRIRGHESKYWLGLAVTAFKGVAADWENRGQTCPVRPEAYTNLGTALLRQDKTSVGLAVMNFNKALELRKDFFPAYFALSDAYLNLGKKEEALGVIEEGLKYVPDSKGLLRRFRELGGKTPPTPIVKSNPQQPPQPDKTLGARQTEPGVTAEEKQAPVASSAPQPSAGPGPESSMSPPPASNKAAGASAVAAPEAVVSEPPKIGSPKNPYCRFCPD
jgi:hypothetical protein